MRINVSAIPFPTCWFCHKAAISHRRILADGSATVDANGKLYFVDNYFQRIYGWSADEGLQVVRDDTLDPVNLAVDKSGDLMVLSSRGLHGTVYSFKPGTPATELTVIEPRAAAPHPGAETLLPGNWWVNGEFKDQLDPKTYEFTTLAEMFHAYAGQPKTQEYVSPDGSLVPRSQPGALIEDEEASLAQTLSLVRDHQVTAIDGSTVAVNAQSVCLHGDGAHALAFAKRIRERLTAEGIAITPLA